MATKKITVALDWTPNTNHVGMFLALEKGLYADCGLEVDFVSPDADGYAKTPRMRVESGEAMFGVCPSETVISCHTSDPDKPKLVAVAALLQKQTSAIVTLKSSGIDRPRLLDGRKYASYQGRFEMDIVRQLVRDDGGEGTVEEVVPGEHGLGIFNTLLREPDRFDATWVFMPWEGVIARRSGADLHVLPLDGIPYGYTPVLVAHPDLAAAGGGGGGGGEGPAAAARAFLAATAEGYRLAAADPAAAAAAVVRVGRHRGVELTPEMVEDSAKELQDAYLDSDGRWGRMEGARWAAFSGWLFDRALVRGRDGAPLPPIDPAALFTNALLPP